MALLPHPLIHKRSHAGPECVGVFGGTFDPIHFGHLRLAEEARERFALDRVLFVPAGDPYHRGSAAVAGAAHRLDMVRLAVENNPAFVCDDREVHRDGPSYTIDTLEELVHELPQGTRFVLLLGLDAFSHILSWKRVHDIFRYANVVVAARDAAMDWEAGLASVVDALRERFIPEGASFSEPAGQIATHRLFDMPLSATYIRHLIEQGRSVRYLLPSAVVKFIHINHLYECPEPQASSA